MSQPDQTLVILSPAFPANERETSWLPFAQLLIKEIKRQFPELNIVILSFQYPYEKGEYEWNKIRVVSFGGMNKGKLKRFFLRLNIWKELKKINNEHNVIGLFSFWCGECALIGRWFAKRNRLKHFCWICGQDARKSNKMVKWIRPKAEELVAISDSVAKIFTESHGIKPAHLIPNAIDKKIFPEFSNERNIDIIGVGSLSILKNYDQFVSMTVSLKTQFPGIKAALCGSGEDEINIKELVKRSGLENNLILYGEISHPEVISKMQTSKILLHPSSYEGFSTVCLEALYAGAYVISYTKPMNHDIKNWYVVKNMNEMIEKASELLQIKDLPHERVMVYSIETSAKTVMNLFKPAQ